MNKIESQHFSNFVKPESIQHKRCQELWSFRIDANALQHKRDLDELINESSCKDNFHAGDHVLVKAGTFKPGVFRDSLLTSKGNSRKKLPPIWANMKPSFEFAKLMYLFNRDEKEFAHAQWFAHGGETIMGELANSRELFLLTC